MLTLDGWVEQARVEAIGSRAMAGVQPNFLDSGQSTPAPLVRMRQKTLAPGAARAILCSSASLSKANMRTPMANARAMSDSFLMVLP